MRLVIPSIENQNHRYCLYSNFSDVPTRGNGLSSRLTAFDTYGDAETQHSHEWDVQPDAIDDFLRSLLLFISEHDPADWLEGVDLWPSEQSDKHVRPLMEFAATPLFKDDDKQYHRTYNLREQKVSTAPSKQHDKRWEPVAAWMDGSFGAFIGLTKDEREPGLLGLYAWAFKACAIVEKYSQLDIRQLYKIEPAVFHERINRFEKCDSQIQAARRYFRSREHAKRTAEHIRWQIEQEAAKTTDAPDYEDTAAGFQNERTLELAGITPQRRTE